MNIFRLVADLMHLLSIFILLHKIRKTRSCVGKLSAGLSLSRSSGGTQCRTRYLGISFKSQLLYTIVFLTRYLDLFTKFISVYNTVMKIFFIGSSVYILYLMKFKYKATYDANLDTFRIEYLLGASAVMGLAFPHKYTVMEVTSWVILGGFLPHFSNKRNYRFYGRSRSGSNPSRFCPSCSCFSVRARPKLSRLTISLHSVSTGRCILSTGFTATYLTTTFTGSPGLLVCSKPLCTVTFSTFTIPSEYMHCAQ